MSGTITTSELIDRLVKQSGIRKKLAVELLRVIPEVIEEGLLKDGVVRVKGLGTFRMKWTQSRPGRNPKTGEIVAIPPHYRLSFLPERSLKDFINRDNRLLSYKVIPAESIAVSRQSEDRSQKTEEELLMNEKVPEEVVKDREESINYEYEPEVPVRKRRVHWIVPVAIVVIAALSVVFYFRNFRDSSQEAVSSSQSVDSKQLTVDRSQQTLDTVPGSEFQVPGSGVDSETLARVNDKIDTQAAIKPDTALQVPNLEPGTRNQEPQPITPEPITPTQDSRLKTQDSKLVSISEGKHLFQLAREEYGNPFLWVLIYKANKDIIKDPDQAIIGKTVKIPALEGTPEKLSRNDSLEVAEGYRLVYEFYNAKGDPGAEDFNKAYQRYLFE